MSDKTNELEKAVEAWKQKHEASGFRIHSGAVMCFEEGFAAGYDHAAEMRWIPIRSAGDLPKENGYYLATCGSVGIDPDDTTSHELNWFNGKWYLPSDEMIEMDGVIAWMKKPKPYTGPADNIVEVGEPSTCPECGSGSKCDCQTYEMELAAIGVVK